MNRNSIVTVIGGSGFLGIYVVRQLAKLGVRIQVISRYASLKASQLRVAGAVGQIAIVDCNALDFKNLEKYINGSDYVVNLVGVFLDRGKQNFNAIHHSLPGKIAELCKKHGVKKLVHISALGVDKNKSSAYATSKLAGEGALLATFHKSTIIRPSAMFGPEDNFINMFNNIAKISPILPLIGGGITKLQPIYVDNVAQAIVACLNDSTGTTDGKILEIAGPKAYSLREIVEFILKSTNRSRMLLTLPFCIAQFIGRIMSIFIPNPPLTVDMVKLLKQDNVLSDKNNLESLSIKPTAMEVIVPEYLD
jgi:NADH dehydrogenase